MSASARDDAPNGIGRDPDAGADPAPVRAPRSTRRRRLVGGLGAAALAPFATGALGAPSVDPATGAKVLRYAFRTSETGFDPAQVSDLYSRIVTGHIFEAPLTYDPLARPYRLMPCTAAEMPQVSPDFKEFVFRIKPGIFFADDPAFKGKKRELVAQDHVYAIKRHFDPRLKSPAYSNLRDEGFLGLDELYQEVVKTKQPFDYDREVEGLKAIDRYTFRVRLKEGRPRHLYTWAGRDLYGAVAREVVEAYGDKTMEHPVGTGPFRLTEWRRSSRIVLSRNPGYREVFYEAQPAADDAEGQALVKRFAGRKLPMIDRVELAIIEEPQPRWLAFLNGEQNFLERLPEEFAEQAIPNGKLAPNLAKRGFRANSEVTPSIDVVIFNMEDPMVGGYTPADVALRRALVLGTDMRREIALARRGQAVPAQSIIPPQTSGYRRDLRTEMTGYDLARAKALLDLYGYVDRDGDGWRERPDGTPLRFEVNTQTDQTTRALDELWKKSMDALGIRMVLKPAQWPENLKAARSGKFMVWRVGSLASSPDGQGSLERAYGGSIGLGNFARFKLPAFDAVYEKLKGLPDGPERQAQFDLAVKLMTAYVPYRMMFHRIVTDIGYPEVIGYRRPPFSVDWWQYIDIDPRLAGGATAG
jgi:ABC-type transport system substrate-binding protein